MQKIRGSSNAGNPPLVLIHDGSGTTTSYHTLANFDLGSDLYAIEYPLLDAAKPWKGGIASLAEAYSALIEMELGRSPVMLGGWSFGGLVALEMVQTLSDRYGIVVKGIVLLDTVCPVDRPRAWTKRDSAAALPSFDNILPNASCLSSKLLVMNMFKHSADMAHDWIPPHWQGAIMAAGPVPCHCPRERSLRWAEGVSQVSGPPVVLVRCDGRLSEQPGASECLVDDSRDCQTLGWEHARPGLVSQVLSCDAHHFNIFLGGQVTQTSRRIRDAVQLIQSHCAKGGQEPRERQDSGVELYNYTFPASAVMVS